MTQGVYANVIVDISREKLDRPFQYRIPDELKGKIVEFAGYALPVQYSGVLPVFSVLVSFTYRNT